MPIGRRLRSRRGQIERNVRVVDVSSAGDWSMVRVWYAPIGDLGLRANLPCRALSFRRCTGRIGQGPQPEPVWAQNDWKPATASNSSPLLGQ